LVNYAYPITFFPSYDDIVRKSTERSSTPFEHDMRERACEGYRNYGSPDSELSRFMVPSLPQQSALSEESFFQQLRGRSWIASASRAPFIPATVTQYLTALYAEPRSIAHLIGATYSSFMLLYCAEDAEIQLPQLHYGSHELLCIFIEPSVKVRIKDRVYLEKAYAGRSLVGVVGSDALLSIVHDFDLPDSQLIQHERWYLGNKAQLHQEHVLTGGIQSWISKGYRLDAQAQVEATFLAALHSNEQSVLTTVQEHTAPGASSSMLVKAALTESSRSFYRGTIVVDHDAPQSIAHQQQRALMLSSQAQTCAIPSLEVATHEVSCSHGSAAGKVNEDEMWYLHSRGFSKEEAETVLIEGFFNEPIIIQRKDILERMKKILRQNCAL